MSIMDWVSDRIDAVRWAMSENPMEGMGPWDDPNWTGLDPIQMEYAQRLAEERMLKHQQEVMAMQNMMVGGIDPAALTAGPSGVIAGGPVSAVIGPGSVVWRTGLKPMAIYHEVTQEEKDADKRRHLKLFVHFAKEFCTRYPQWAVIPDEADPFHSVRLVRKDIGAVIHNLYPDNQMAVYGGPASWTDPRKELGQPLPLAKINTQEFWGWCIGMDDVPEWMVK